MMLLVSVFPSAESVQVPVPVGVPSRVFAVLITPSLMILPVIVVPEIMFGPVMAAGFPSNVKTNFIPVPVDTLRALPTASIDILSGVSERTVCGFQTPSSL